MFRVTPCRVVSQDGFAINVVPCRVNKSFLYVVPGRVEECNLETVPNRVDECELKIVPNRVERGCSVSHRKTV